MPVPCPVGLVRRCARRPGPYPSPMTSLLRRTGLPAVALGAGTGALLVAAMRARSARERRRTVLDEVLHPGEAEVRHARKVARIAGQLRGRRGSRPLSIRKRVVSHQVPKAGDLKYKDEKLDLTDLHDILSIDPARRICVAESGVTFEDLVAATMRHGLVPIVVPELKTITLGGAVSGCSIESTSFRHGGFHDTCLEYEVVTSSGEKLRCTPDNEHALVFQMMHGSFGTLGILTKIAFRLMPASPFVKVTYETYGSVADYEAAIRRHYEAQDADFMDGIVHSPSECVLSLGRFVEDAPYTHAYDWMRVYYRSTRTRREDYLRTPDYFFRYDRGVTNVRPQSFLGRLLFGKLMGSDRWLRLAEKANPFLRSEQIPFTLDVFLPLSRMEPFLAWYAAEFRHFPLWCVPYKRVRDYEWIAPGVFQGVEDGLFVDLAIYGMKQDPKRNLHRIMERKLMELGGIKTLISENHYSEEEFWRTWNRENYARVKAKTDPGNVFRDLYEKTCRAYMGIV